MNDTKRQNNFDFKDHDEHDALGTVLLGSEAPSRHDANTVPLTKFSLTRDEVVLMYQAAGIDVKRRTVSRYAQEGLLQAQKVDAERGLKRYLFSKRSVEEDIERRKRGPNPVYAAIDEADDEDNDAKMPNETAASSVHRAATEQTSKTSRGTDDLVHDLEIKLAQAEARNEEKEVRHVEDVNKIHDLAEQNGQLRISLGKYMGRTEELEAQVLRLNAGKKNDGPEPDADHDDGVTKEAAPQPTPERPSRWRRLFGRQQ